MALINGATIKDKGEWGCTGETTGFRMYRRFIRKSLREKDDNHEG
ncbi:hypothetical protein PANA5342_3770 [Pantoea ananatis LMG 5342]|nr:hypothetical protein PANA5342_3770 [Pantoea ananatis LMG 5342]